MKTSKIVCCIFFCYSFVSSAQSEDSHVQTHAAKHVEEHGDVHEHGHNDVQRHKDEHGHGEEGVTTMDDAMAEQVGIVIARTQPQTLHQTFTSYGRLTTAPEHTSHVRARFPGVVRTVAINLGDKVKTGDLLAVIESNVSLKDYEVRAPINGTIIQRHANAGEMTQEQILFSISSFESLWAELRIFPSQQKLLNIGQPVKIKAGEKEIETQISHVLPPEDESPYIIARAKINGNQNNWFPGLMVEGVIVINEFNAALAVKKIAIQNLGGQIGIFVKESGEYHFTPVVLGRSDDDYSEVLSGVEKNTQYVVENSYLIKADIEKSEAAHEH